MPKLTINGQTVTVDDSFDALSPQQQEATVDEIAKSLRSSGPPSEETGLQEVNRRAGNLATGVNTALGGPVDAASWLINKAYEYARAPKLSDILPSSPSAFSSQLDAAKAAKEQPPEKLITNPALGSQWFHQTFGKTEPKDALDQLLQSTGEGIGGAVTGYGVGSALQAAGRAPTVARVLQGGGTDARNIAGTLTAGAGAGAGGELGDWAGGALFNDDPLARTIGRTLGGFAGGVVGGAPTTIRRPVRAPSSGELDAAGNAGYDALRLRGPEIDSTVIADRARQLMRGEFGRLHPEKSATQTYGQLDDMLNPNRSWTTMSELMATRDRLNALARNPNAGSDAPAAGKVVREIEDLLGSLNTGNTRPNAATARPMAPDEVSTTLDNARRNIGAAKRSERLVGNPDEDVATLGLLPRAEASPSSIDQALRVEARNMMRSRKQMTGFSQEESDALAAVRDPSGLRSGLSWVGRLGSPSGSLGTAWLGNKIGELFGAPWVGMAAGPAIGVGSRLAAGELARRSLRAVDEMVRSRSPLMDQMRLGQPAVPGLTRDEAVIRALVPGLLAMPARTRLEYDDGR